MAEYFEQQMQEHKLPYGHSLEVSHQDVTECFGLQFPYTQQEITQECYLSKCDPRLNQTQTLKMMQLLHS